MGRRIVCVWCGSMAEKSATINQTFEYNEKGKEEGKIHSEVSREEIQAAIAKAVELRALHAALMQSNNSPSSAAAGPHLRFPSASPVSHHLLPSHFSAQDYPVFTPVSILFNLIFLNSFSILVMIFTIFLAPPKKKKQLWNEFNGVKE